MSVLCLGYLPSRYSSTVQESIRLYESGKYPDQIAKIRSLSIGTIIGHLLEWYGDGGDFKIDDHLSKEKEKVILETLSNIDRENLRLGYIKEKLPDDISYSDIKMTIAKIKRISITT